MNDNELADKVVALGVGRLCPDRGFQFRTEDLSGVPQEFVRDWRVAGALMEKCVDINVSYRHGDHIIWNAAVTSTQRGRAYGESESLPRAIIEACVEALS
jgi:hypothetical protein